MSLQYLSTRGEAPELDFEGVLLAGLAQDGGLYLPKTLPQFSAAELQSMRGMSYTELATTVIAPFVEDSIDRETLAGLVEASYRDFRHQRFGRTGLHLLCSARGREWKHERPHYGCVDC